MDLSDEEQELLIEAGRRGGQLALLSAGQLPGAIVGIGGVKFNSDPARAARYRDALHSLVRRGYVEHRGGIAYTLTGAGYTKARELKQA